MALSGSGGIRQQISLVGDAEVKAAFDRIGASGQRAFEQINRGTLTAARGLNTVGQSTDVAASGFVRLRSGLTGIQTSFTGIARAGNTLKEAFAGLAAFESVRRSIDVFKEGLDSLREVRNTAAGTGVATDTVKAFQVAMSQAGLAGERAGPALVQFMGTVSDAQRDLPKLGNSLFSTIDVLKGTEGSARAASLGINTMRGNVSSLAAAGKDFAKVFRGGTEAPLVNLGEAANEQAKSFARLGIDVSKYGRTQAEVDRLLEDTAKQFVRLRETVPADVIRSMSLAFGEDDIVKFSKTLEIIATQGLPALKRQAADLGLGPSKEDNDRLLAYDTAVGNLNLRLLALKQQAAIAFAPFVSLEARGAENFIKGLTIEIGRIRDGLVSLGGAGNDVFESLKGSVSNFAQSSGLTDLFVDFWAKFAPAGSRALDSFIPKFQSWATSLGPLIENPWATFKSSAGSAFDAIGEALNSRIQIMTAAIAAFGQAKDEGDIWAALKAGFSATLQSLTDSLNSWIETAAGIFADLGTRIQDALTGAFNWVSDQITSLSNSLSSLFGSIGTASGAPGGNLEGFAGGGMISGPGTGTSDSVPIWASDGEWMMRAKAVDYWGVPFMAAINSLRNPFKAFSMGGLVTALSAPLVPRSAPRFASGGMVTATTTTGGGTTVVLNIGGVSHRLSTDDATGDSLIRLSRKHRMLAA